MPDVPERAITAAVDAVMEGRGLKSGHSRAWAEAIVTDALEAAAPILAEGDVVVCTAPETPSTEQQDGEKEA